ncbi:MAG: hypothetical protein HZC48_01835 [Nitrospirae bacterium]|nr:hypothetical protein [Nitrospirota bacterium]
MSRMMKKLLLIIVIIYSGASFCYALETDTHENFNEYIARNTLNSFSLDAYVKERLGVQGGIEEKFNAHELWWWLRKGGEYEDKPYWWMPYLRSVNHFHNPLTDEGFSGIWGSGSLSGVSSIQWSQWPLGAQTIQVLGSGNYSWYDSRDYFYKALTNTNKASRDNYYAEMFRGLGQLMHLVEDLSVPEHTRDDGHYFFYNYEKWVKETIKTIADISQYTPIYFDSSAIGNPNPLASIPVANLFDTNQYNNPNPDPNVTTNLVIDPNGNLLSNIGLSEYTNANFLSPDSYFTSAFPYPNLGSVVEYDETIDGKKRTYLRKLGQGETDGGQVGNGDHIEHLALGGWLYKFLPGDLKKQALRPVYSEKYNIQWRRND